MPTDDSLRWNKRYTEAPLSSFEQPRPFLLEHASLLPAHGLALDAAMGLGGNAGYLLSRGLRVIGVDISEVAIRIAKAAHPTLMAVLADLNHFYLPPSTFDLILNFFYLQRSLWPAYRGALRPGGLLFIQTLTIDMRGIRPDIDPSYLLQPGELRHAFEDLEILTYREGWETGAHDHRRAVASLVARR